VRSITGFDARLLDHFTASIVVTDPDGLIVGWNRGAERTFGWPADQALGQSVVDLLVPEAHASLAAEVIGRIKSGRPWEGEFDVRHKDGTTFKVYSVESPILDEEGTVLGMIALSIDLTVGSRVGSEARRTHELYRLVIENAQDLISMIDLEGRVQFASPSLETVLGYTPEELVGTTLYDYVHPDDLELAARAVREGVEEGRGSVSSLRLRHKDGRWVEIEGTGTAVYDDDGNVEYMLGMAREVSEQRRADKAVKQAQAQLLERERTARETAEAAEHRLMFLLRATTWLGSSLDYEATLDNLARLAVGALADVCIVDLEENGRMRRMAAVHRDPAKQPLVDRIRTYTPDIAGDHPAARVMRSGRPEYSNRITEEMTARASPKPEPDVAEAGRQLGTHAYICVPITVGDRAIGTIMLLSTDPDRVVEDADVRLAADLARRAGLAVDNARLHAETEHAVAIKEESLALLDTLLATAPVGLGFVDRDLRYVRINDTLAAMTAAAPEAHIGRTVRDMVPTLADSVEPLHRQVLETGEPVLDVEISGVIPGGRGTRGHWLSSYYPVRAPDGSILGVGVVVVDITEQKRTEGELRVARQELTDQLADLTKLLQLSGRLSASLELQPVLEEVLAAVVELQNAEMGVLRLYDPEREDLWIAASMGMPEEYLTTLNRVSARGGVWGRAFAERRPFVSADVDTDPTFENYRDAARRGGYRAVYTSPLITRRGDLIGTIATHFRRPTRPTAREERLLELYAFEASDVIDNARLYAEAQEARDRLEFLAEASRMLSASLDYRRTLQQVARLVVPRLADWCAIDVRDDDGSIRQLAVAHVDPEKVKWARELQKRYPPDPNAPTGAPNVIRTGQAELYPEIPQELIDTAVGEDQELRRIVDEIGFSSLMVVPLIARGRTLGAITFVMAESGRRYGSGDLAFAEDLARRAAQGVDNASLFSQQRHIARTLQESLLPPALPQIPGVEAAARYRAAGVGTEVGGDFYDLFETDAGEWAVVIGDVCGKGPEAAAVTGLARYTIRAAAMQEHSPSGILSVLNEAIRQQRQDLRFATVAYMRLQKRDGGADIQVACGGHPLPLVVRRDGSVESVGRPGTLLGIFESADLADDGLRLEPGDALILYTDGLSQERSGAGPLTEEELSRLIGAAAGSSADDLADRLLASAAEGEMEAGRDDVAVLVIRVQP
jgi:PAS domain S-box-containing protein